MNTGIIITARVKSSRLHEKVLQEINGKTTIEILLDHVINDKFPVILAIPESPDDDRLKEIAESKGIEVYRGQDTSPLHRLYECAKENDFDHVVRITADDILIDLTLLFLQTDFHVKGNRDYTFLRQCPEGVAGEVFSFKALEGIVKKVGNKPVEFVSYYVKSPEYNWIEYYPPFEYKWSFRLTMDYEEDLILLRILYSLLKRPGTLDIINLLKQNKYLLRINKLPKVTIFTTAYNTSQFIKKTMESVFDQTYDDFEYIVIDDASTDDTSKKVGEFMEAIGPQARNKIQFIRNAENKGQSFNSNRALEMARGKYVMCLDSDDILRTDALDIMVRMIEESILNDGGRKSKPVDCVLSGYTRIDEDGKELETVDKNEIHLGCALVSTWLINELKFKEGIRYKMGTEFLERLKNNCTINYIYDNLWYYRKREGQLTQEKEHPDWNGQEG